MYVNFGHKTLDLTEPVVMGVVNVTPDSFSDGGRYPDPASAIRAARDMIEAGAAIIDIGGESTRPGAEPVPEQEQLDRVMPILESLKQESDALVSVDTGDAAVIHAVTQAGADMINDVFSLRKPGALRALHASGAAVCLMHMLGEPKTMQCAPVYRDLWADVTEFLDQRAAACQAAGVSADRIVVDPGFGFGKTDAHNLALLAGLDQLNDLGFPILVALSRKAMLGRLTGQDVDGRVAAGLAAAVMAIERGASIVRTHDVPQTVDALRIVQAVTLANAMEPERPQELATSIQLPSTGGQKHE